MSDALVDMNHYPPELALHRALLDDARTTLLAMRPSIEANGQRLDDVVVVVAEPALAARLGKPVVAVHPLGNLMATIGVADARERLAAVPPDGWVRVVVLAGGSLLVLSMNLSGSGAWFAQA